MCPSSSVRYLCRSAPWGIGWGPRSSGALSDPKRTPHHRHRRLRIADVRGSTCANTEGPAAETADPGAALRMFQVSITAHVTWVLGGELVIKLMSRCCTAARSASGEAEALFPSPSSSSSPPSTSTTNSAFPSSASGSHL